MGSNTGISVLSLIPYWIAQWQTKQSPLGASLHGVQSVEHDASPKHPWYGCFTQTWPCSFWPGSSKMWSGVGHFHADAQFQHFATSLCDTRGKVEIKLSLCKSYPTEGAWNWTPQITSHYLKYWPWELGAINHIIYSQWYRFFFFLKCKTSCRCNDNRGN